jgi:microcystin-dependent protein
MSLPFVGEIRMFGGNFAPAGWMFCQGQEIPISENETLYNLIGTTYGGDGDVVFALPDLRGRIPIHQGNGFSLAQAGGAEEVTLTVDQIASHSHPLTASTNPGISSNAQGNTLSSSPSILLYIEGQAPDTNLNASVVGAVGGSQPHSNFQPYLCVSFIISLFGIYPPPN